MQVKYTHISFQMASSRPLSPLYKVKFRVHNYVYEELMTAELFEDMRVNGLQSQVVHEVKQTEAKSLAVGTFEQAVEIMYIEPCRNKEPQSVEGEVMYISFIIRKEKYMFNCNRNFYLG